MSRAAWLYYFAVLAAAAGVLARVLIPHLGAGIQPGWWVTLLELALLFLVCDSLASTLTSRQSSWSPASAFTLAAVVLLGPAGAATVGATVLFTVRRGLRLRQRVFNAAMFTLSPYAAAETYL